jgi:hypothetical protein
LDEGSEGAVYLFPRPLGSVVGGRKVF